MQAPASPRTLVPSERAESAKFSWLRCFCVVDFDLELGQTLQACVPQTAWSQVERNEITFLSFPDTNSHLSGDIPFCFRFSSSTSPSTYYYGFAFFRQRKDESIKRGYMQKAVALISEHPYFSLFGQVMSQVAPTFFASGLPLLEACLTSMQSWPSDPYSKASHDLPLLGSTIAFRMPELASPARTSLLPPLAAPSPTLTPRQELTASLQGVNLYSVFHSLQSSLWTLWELVLLGEPLLVLGSSPPLVAQAVLALTSLVWPLSYAGDFRPFFNIHSDAFRSMQAAKSPALPSVLLGVTNPFILKTLKGWPHVLQLPEPPGTSVPAKGLAGKSPPSPSKDAPPLSTTHVPILQPDKDVVQHLAMPRAQSVIGAAAVNNELIRAHFMQRTLVFLSPLEEYVTQAFNNAWRKSTPFVSAPLAPFVASEFLAWYRTREGSKPGAESRLALMDRFLRTGNFAAWLADRRADDEAKLREVQAQALRGLSVAMRSRSELEKIDVLISCQAAQKRAGTLPVPVAVLQEQMALIMEQLPVDLRRSLEKPPDSIVAV